MISSSRLWKTSLAPLELQYKTVTNNGQPVTLSTIVLVLVSSSQVRVS